MKPRAVYLDGQEIDWNEHNEGLKELYDIEVLDNLYKDPEKLDRVTAHDTVILDTTGLYHKEVKELVDRFYNLGWSPKKVVFLSERAALRFCGLVRDLKKAGFEVKSYFYFSFDNSEEEINWI